MLKFKTCCCSTQSPDCNKTIPTTDTSPIQVCVQPPTAAVNLTLLTCADCRCSWAPALQQLQRMHHSAANMPYAAAVDDRWNRQTDGRTPYCYIDPATYYASSVNNKRPRLHATKSINTCETGHFGHKIVSSLVPINIFYCAHLCHTNR